MFINFPSIGLAEQYMSILVTNAKLVKLFTSLIKTYFTVLKYNSVCKEYKKCRTNTLEKCMC